MKTIRTLAATLIIGVAFIAAGCGGDDDSSTSTGASGASGASGPSGSALTKPDFIKQADAICAAGDKEIQGGQDFGQQPTDSQLQQFVDDTLAPAIQGEVDGIEALTPPEGDEDQIDAITAAAQQGIEDTKADPSTLLEDGPGSPFAEANKLASAYGLKVCGQ